MLKKIAAMILALCLVIAVSSPSAMADDDVYFTAINETVLPLSDATMPAYYNGALCVPYTVFTSNNLDIYFASLGDGDVVCLYSADKILFFDLSAGTSYNQNNINFTASAESANGTIYVPVYFVSSFFGFRCTNISTMAAPVIRIKTGSVIYSDSTFAGIYKSQLQTALTAYYSIPDDPAPAPDDPVTGSDSVSISYENVTIFLSFNCLSAGYCEAVLDALDTSGFGACFFVTGNQIAENADLIRRISGSGYSIGIWLEDGTYEEYEAASSLLYEAAKTTTLFVSSGTAVTADAEETADLHSLIFWYTSVSYGADEKITKSKATKSISTVEGSRENIMFACSESGSLIMPEFLLYLSKNGYSVKLMTETSTPLLNIDGRR